MGPFLHGQIVSVFILYNDRFVRQFTQLYVP